MNGILDNKNTGNDVIEKIEHSLAVKKFKLNFCVFIVLIIFTLFDAFHDKIFEIFMKYIFIKSSFNKDSVQWILMSGSIKAILIVIIYLPFEEWLYKKIVVNNLEKLLHKIVKYKNNIK
ncbi:MAG: hypothetical protein MR601_04645 [Erysipelotrichaceae bacterium]|nr:hypothetical protein [Erysipelotrichaceae bacterium]